MMPKMSICVFIKDNIEGAFCLFEAMVQLIPYADEYVIMDLGSTDGTLEILKSLAMQNRKIRLESSSFHTMDASIFATLANDLVGLCKNDLVLFHQADEIWHENLLKIMGKRLEEDLANGFKDFKGYSFWRYQLAENLQVVKWFPHPVHRIGMKGEKFVFTGDGMNTTNYFEPPLCATFDGGWFARWGETFKAYPTLIPTHEMILDISSSGMFINNLVAKRAKHAPIWKEDPNTMNHWGGGSVNMREWIAQQEHNMNWYLRTSPFQVPKVIQGLIGESKYHARPEILDAIARGGL